MKNIPYILIVLSLILTLKVNAQVFQDQLDEIYLNTEVVEVNEFQNANQTINNNREFRLKRALKRARQSQDTLEFKSQNGQLFLTELEYLKVVRKTANQSNDSVEFISKLAIELPELKTVIQTDESYEDLYHTIRPQTFYGRIDTLPEVL